MNIARATIQFTAQTDECRISAGYTLTRNDRMARYTGIRETIPEEQE